MAKEKKVKIKKEKVEKELTNKVSALNSLRTQIYGMTAVAIIATVIIIIAVTVPASKKSTTGIIQNYMVDMAKLTGNSVSIDVANKGFEAAMTYEDLNEELSGVDVEGMSSSYAYVVDSNGIMKYHPTPDKVGNPVENDAVKQILGEISKGVHPEPAVITYNFKGVNKYAAYYVSANNDFIIVVTADESEILAPIQSTVNLSIIAGIIALFVCGGCSILVASVIVKPIILTTQQVSKLANLDLSKSDDPQVAKAEKIKSETGVMMRAMKELSEKLSAVVTGISENTEQLSEASRSMSESAMETTAAVDQVEKAIGEIAEGATSQAQETQTATENIIIIGNMIAETNDEVAKLGKNAIAMRDAGNTALDILSDLDATNNQTMDAIHTIAEQTNVTNDSALKIKDATIIISNIAEETNLLSLNASIEAARAGEQGRGFAVVATQIQKLAEQSDESAKKIEEIVNLLIEESERAVATMDDVKSVIIKQSDNVEKTSKAFKDVKVGIDNSIQSVSTITAKTKQLDAARVKVVDVVQNLSAIAEENAASSEETSASATEMSAIMGNIAQNAKDLDSVAERLTDDISKFKF